MLKGPIALIVLDGFGLAEPGPGNAVELADTPNFDRLWQQYPHTTLTASGEGVGLPKGQIGNSEVGHMNLGAGRIVEQSLTWIGQQIESGQFFENRVLNEVIERSAGGALHLLGLVSGGGVHSDLPHLLALIELARRRFDGPVYIHAFTDGRDTAPRSALGFLGELEEFIAESGSNARIASVTGRYFAMDRDRRWQRTRVAYDAVVCGEATHHAGTALKAVQEAYDRGENDEFISPTVIVTEDGNGPVTMADGDGVIFFNFRADRARQFSYALLGPDDWNEFDRCRTPKVGFASLMEYDAKLGAPFAFALPPLEPSLAQVLSEAGLRQFHAAETEKYAHVTYFFNAKREQPFPGEERLLVPSPSVATYDLQPEMSAPELTAQVLQRITDGDDHFILVNFANPDMVGHSGVLEAAIKACEASDIGMGKLVDAVLQKGGAAIVLADHGNAEVMIDDDNTPHTAHTTNQVPCIVAGAGDLRLRGTGVLGDVAPTILELLGIPAPPEMTGVSLIED